MSIGLSGNTNLCNPFNVTHVCWYFIHSCCKVYTWSCVKKRGSRCKICKVPDANVDAYCVHDQLISVQYLTIRHCHQNHPFYQSTRHHAQNQPLYPVHHAKTTHFIIHPGIKLKSIHFTSHSVINLKLSILPVIQV